MQFISKEEMIEFLRGLPDDTVLYLGWDEEIEYAFGGEFPLDATVLMDTGDGVSLIGTSMPATIIPDEEDERYYTIYDAQESPSTNNTINLDELFEDDEEIPSITVNFHK